MEKRKALSKQRLVKSKLDFKKVNIEETHSHSASRLAKANQVYDIVKKNATPTGQKLLKSKQSTAKSLLDTPKLKPEIFDRKFLLVQEPNDSNYMNLVSSFMEKIIQQKARRQELEEKLKILEMGYRNKEVGMRKEFEQLQAENKVLKREKIQQENRIMEENFLIRREHEDMKSQLNTKISEIISLLQSSVNTKFKEVSQEVQEKLLDLSPMEESQPFKLDFKDTASFSYMEPEVITPPAAISNGFMEAIALHPHLADSPDEINLSAGDRVLVFNNDEDTNWWIGKVGEDIGKFPKTCVMLD